MPRRRTFLATVAAAGLAGCSGGEPTRDVGTPTGPPPTLEAVDGAWTRPRGDAAGTRHAADGAVPATYPLAAWTVESDASWSHVVVVGGTAYVAGSSAVVAFDAATGERRWERPLEGTTGVVGPAVGEAVYVGVGREVRALAPEDGATMWTAATGGNAVERVVADGDVVYAATNGSRGSPGGVQSFAGGERRWRYVPEDVSAVRFTSLAVGEETVAAAGQNVGGSGWHVALEPASGDVRWATPGVTNSRAVTVADGALLAGGLHGTVVAQELSDGTLRWRSDVGPGVEAVATDGDRAYVAGKDEDGDNFRAVSLADGTERWSSGVGRTVLSSGDGLVVAGQGRVRGLDADGTRRWERRRGTTPRGLALAGDVLFTVGYDGDLRALAN